MRKFTVVFDTPLHVSLNIVVSALSFGDAVTRAWRLLEAYVCNTVGYQPVEVILHLNVDVSPENLCDNLETPNQN